MMPVPTTVRGTLHRTEPPLCRTCANECVHKSSPSAETLTVTNIQIDFKLVVCRRIKKLRAKANISQEVLAERCGIYRTYLSRIESGSANPTLVVLVALASTLGIKPGELLVVDPTTDAERHKRLD